MGEVVQFPQPKVQEPEFDLFSTVDVAIRDLRDIALNSSDPWACRRAAECGLMLGQAFQAALRDG